MTRHYELVRQNLARNLRERREQHSISQEALALSAGVDRTYVSQIERGIGNPSLHVMCKLAAVFGTDVAELLSANKRGKP
jgi:transcriptional regulator with XRE-family HTH domain